MTWRAARASDLLKNFAEQRAWVTHIDSPVLTGLAMVDHYRTQLAYWSVFVDLKDEIFYE